MKHSKRDIDQTKLNLLMTIIHTGMFDPEDAGHLFHSIEELEYLVESAQETKGNQDEFE